MTGIRPDAAVVSGPAGGILVAVVRLTFRGRSLGITSHPEPVLSFIHGFFVQYTDALLDQGRCRDCRTLRGPGADFPERICPCDGLETNRGIL